MKKEDFKRELRNALIQTPLTTRKKWDASDLMTWRQYLKSQNSYIMQDGVKGDPWQLVHSYCQDLIGKYATQ